MTTLSVAWARLHGIRVAWRNDAPGAELAVPGSGGRGSSARPGPAPAQPPEADTAAYPDWDAIYTDNVGRIYRLLFAKVGNKQDAEDLTSQVFLAALGPLRTTASVGEVRAYLLATARTALAAHWRRTLGHQVTVIDPAGMDLADFAGTADGSRPGGPPGWDPPRSGPDAGPGRAAGGAGGPGGADPGGDLDDADEADPRVRATRILAALPERQRRILSLRFLEGASVKEAAAELGVTVANAKVMQHRALRRAAGLDGQPGRDPAADAAGGAGDGAAEDNGRGAAGRRAGRGIGRSAGKSADQGRDPNPATGAGSAAEQQDSNNQPVRSRTPRRKGDAR